ncbi:hypothetical protein GLAREA_02573 [Glarea lozoyensis ATCC 20868]|uniref:Uncharacterized protein n=1 Tax=Glarea lozoyensis (strain ATCC 20868 / MF5171) TaxID=1116229 RepID=S3CLQ8_GLAL2|nr:uncharacterized protein GLAREA_02573 [Glarea lozoyensis ATCC 20868]EPE26660.1 hypothetical protein GLAREA_02573 [Glarea lozoyensis ATCC 20868]
MPPSPPICTTCQRRVNATGLCGTCPTHLLQDDLRAVFLSRAASCAIRRSPSSAGYESDESSEAPVYVRRSIPVVKDRDGQVLAQLEDMIGKMQADIQQIRQLSVDGFPEKVLRQTELLRTQSGDPDTPQAPKPHQTASGTTRDETMGNQNLGKQSPELQSRPQPLDDIPAQPKTPLTLQLELSVNKAAELTTSINRAKSLALKSQSHMQKIQDSICESAANHAAARIDLHIQNSLIRHMLADGYKSFPKWLKDKTAFIPTDKAVLVVNPRGGAQRKAGGGEGEEMEVEARKEEEELQARIKENEKDDMEYDFVASNEGQ